MIWANNVQNYYEGLYKWEALKNKKPFDEYSSLNMKIRNKYDSIEMKKHFKKLSYVKALSLDFTKFLVV